MVATVGVFGAIGFGVLAYRVPTILKEERQLAREQAVGLARYFQELIAGLEGRLGTLSALNPDLPPAQVQALLDAAVAEGGFAAIFLLDDQGRVAQATLANGSPHVRPNLLGADFSRNPLFASARYLGRRVWSDRYLSARNGEGAVGLAIPIKGYVLLGEVAPDFLRAAIERSTEDIAYPVMVVDGAGEYVAGRNLAESDRLRNWAVELRVESVVPGGDVRELVVGGTSYDAGIARTEKLDWTFMVANPAGWANPRVRVTVLLVVAGFAASLLLALILAPLWASRMSAPLRDLMAQTRALSSGKFGRKVMRGPIQEFNQLASDMESMAEATRQRQAELEQSEERLLQTLQTLQRLNVELESRVERRTGDLARANRELLEAMENLKLAQGELVRNEKLAALGNLVGGIAHELNTPIGNGVMAVTTLHDQVRDFRREMAGGLRRSQLDSFVERVERGSEIAVRNLQRANELIASFKQVAVDQTSVQRRPFILSEVVDEILLTLQPTLRRTPYKVRSEIAAGVAMDSYPGPLGQVLTNLLTNALVHGFEGCSKGLIEITGGPGDEGEVCLTIADDGMGIPPELLDRVFDPFVTSKLGRGGTGLGLHIVWNTVTVVLGGSISVDSAPGQGTRFRIILPVIAPSQPAAD
ncbi:MAG TPA: ATP-binding protein [Azonexus sp.]